MDELVKLVAQKTGLPQEQSKMAVETVIGFLKQKLPAPVAGQLDAVLGGGGMAGGVGDLAKGVGDLLGKK